MTPGSDFVGPPGKPFYAAWIKAWFPHEPVHGCMMCGNDPDIICCTVCCPNPEGNHDEV